MARPTRGDEHIVGPPGRPDTQVTIMAIATRRASRTRRTRTAITFAAAGLLTVVIAPAAFAAPSDDQGVVVQPGDGAVQVQVDTAGAVASEAQGASEGSDDLEAEGGLEVSDHLDSIDAVIELEDVASDDAVEVAPHALIDVADGDAAATTAESGAAVAGPAVAACQDHLVTLTPAGATGSAAHAVAITAQAHEYGQPGWDMAAWAASDGTSLRTVIAQAADGTTSDLPATPTGTAYDVAALTFCGTAATGATSDASAEAADPSAGAEAASEPALPAAETSGNDTAGASAEAPTATMDASTATSDGDDDHPIAGNGGADDQPTGDERSDDEPALGVVRVDTSAPTAVTGADTASGSAPGDDLATLPIARSAPSAMATTSATVFGSTTIGSAEIGLLTVGLLGGALLALAAFRRTGRSERTHLGGRA